MGKYIVLFEISYFAFLNPPSGTSLYYIALLSGSGQLTDCEVADHCVQVLVSGDRPQHHHASTVYCVLL